MRMFSLFFFFVLLVGTLCADEPDILYLTWQHDPTSTMTIRWITKSDSTEKSDNTENRIEYKEASDTLESAYKQAVASCQRLPKDTPYNIHAVELTALKADSVYHFRLAPSKTEYRFRTMPETLNEPVRFIVGGDLYDHNLEPFEKTTIKAAAQNPRFIAFGGDIAYSVQSKKNTHDEFTRWQTFLRSCTKLLKTQDNTIIPMILAIGNHEVEGFYEQTPDKAPFFYALFRAQGEKSYKALQFGTYLHFIILDSGHTNTVYGTQRDWLENTLKSEKPNLHRFVIYHVPAYPSVRCYRGALSSSIRRNWCPLFDKYNIDACFEHHDHAFKRTHPLVNGEYDRFGVVYFGDGCWGTKPRIPKKASRTTYLTKTASSRQFLQVDISKKNRVFQAFDPKGVLIDSYEQPIGKRN